MNKLHRNEDTHISILIHLQQKNIQFEFNFILMIFYLNDSAQSFRFIKSSTL